MGFFTRRDTNDIEVIAQLRAENVALHSRVAFQAATIDSLTTYMNTLQGERQALSSRMLDVSYPVPVYARQNEAPVRPVETHGRAVEDGSAFIIPPHLRDAMPRPAAMSGTVPQSAEDVMATSISAAQASAATFDDPGDDAARALGIEHDPLGNVVHTR